jgi:hypothetical protein
MPDNDEDRRREIARAYMRDWEAKNREHRRAYNKKRYQEKKEVLREQSATRVAAWVKENPEARREIQARYREKNREKLREAHHKYIRDENGELTAEYKARLESKTAKWRQGLEEMAGRPRPEVCDICAGPPDEGKSLHYDHCHQTGGFRGWLCRECNLMLGNARDNPQRLRDGAAYLEGILTNKAD